ncbi:hypothetical protein D3C79_701680 [compost metagenome]
MKHQSHHRVGAGIEQQPRALDHQCIGAGAVRRQLSLQQAGKTAATVTPDHLIMCQGQRLDTPLERRHITTERLVFRGGVGDQRTDERKNVLHPVVELLVEHPLANIRPGTLIGQQLTVMQRDLDHRRTDGFAKLAVLLGPGQAVVVDCLLPHGEALAGGEAVTQGAVLVGLVGVTGPIQGFDHLLAKQHEVVPWVLRHRDDQYPRDLRGIVLGCRVRQRQAVRRPGAALGDTLGEAEQPGHRLPWRRQPGYGPLALQRHANAIAGDEGLEVAQASAQQFIDGRCAVSIVQQVVQHLPGVGSGLQGLPGLQCLDMQGKELAEHFCGHPLAHAQRAWCVMVAGDQPPKGTVDDH